MAFLLFKFVRRKIREHKAKDAIPNTKDSELVESYLVPEVAPGQHQGQHQALHEDQHVDGIRHSTATAESHVEAFNAEEAARHKEEDRRRKIRQWKLMLGLALPNFLASVDVTIVAPAIPLISSHFSKSSLVDAYPSSSN
jgi:hypothetical protein